MLRISWPLALVLAAVIAVIARKPKLLVPIAVVFAIWFVMQRLRGNRPRA